MVACGRVGEGAACSTGIPAAPLLIQFPANVPEKAEKVGSVLGFLPLPGIPG